MDWNLMTETAESVRTLLLSISPDFIPEICSFHDENQQFPSDTLSRIHLLLEKPNEDDEIRDSLLYSLDSIAGDPDEPNSEDFLLNQIFYPTESVQVSAHSEEDFENEIELDSPILTEIQQIKSVETLLTECQELSQRVSTIIHVSSDVSFFLLQRCDWKEDVLYSKWADSSVEMLAQLGLTPDQAEESLSLRSMKGNSEVECQVCYSDFPAEDFFSLICGHFFCKECWTHEILQRIRGCSPWISCMAGNCLCCVTFSDVLRFTDETMSATFSRIVIENHIATDQTLRRCIRPGCDCVLTIDSVGYCNVAVCSCGQRLCWKCREEAHAPLSCALVNTWRTAVHEESLQAKWVVENTKPCPKCHSRIEKNGGCNHMTCRTLSGGGCGYEFCWVCGHEWGSHKGNGYSCNQFVDFDKMSRDNLPKGDLVRLHHYFTRYQNHKLSQSVELEAREKTRLGLIEGLMNRTRMTQEDTELLANQVFTAIDTARSVLIWSYPHACYMTNGSVELRLFEHVQAEVERILEDLTHKVENELETCSPSDFIVGAKILANNTKVLNQHVDGYSH
jgi:ariadne-1